MSHATDKLQLNARLKVNKSLIGSSLFIPHTRGKEFLWGGTLQPLLCECRVLMKIMMMIIVSFFRMPPSSLVTQTTAALFTLSQKRKRERYPSMHGTEKQIQHQHNRKSSSINSSANKG
jgi:hypothetical protein